MASDGYHSCSYCEEGYNLIYFSNDEKQSETANAPSYTQTECHPINNMPNCLRAIHFNCAVCEEGYFPIAYLCIKLFHYFS